MVIHIPALRAAVLTPLNVWRYELGPFFKASTPDTAAPLPASYTEAGAVGALTVTDTGNKLSIGGGVLTSSGFTGGTTPRVVASAGLVRATGLALLLKSGLTGVGSMAMSWQSVSSPADDAATLYWTTTALQIYETGGAGGMSVATLASGTAYDVAIICRPTGYYYLIRGGAFTTWTLLWVSVANAVTPLWAAWRVQGGAVVPKTLENLRGLNLPAPWNTDYGIALARSTFTAANNTALTALTPEIGGLWNAAEAIFTVQSNRLQNSAAAGQGTAWVEAGTADVVIEVSAVNNLIQAIMLRYTDDSNFWYVRVNGANLEIAERNAGTTTIRAMAAYGGGFPARLVVIAQGSTIQAFANNASAISYTSASLNQASTKHGIRAGSIGAQFDDFIIWPRTISLPSGV